MNPDILFPTLYAKTYFILGVQLAITWLSAWGTIRLARLSVKAGLPWFRVEQDGTKHGDLVFNDERIAHFIAGTIVAFILFFVLLLLFGGLSLKTGMILFGLWSVTTGVMVAMCLLAVYENLGPIVLALTMLITLITGLIGTLSGMDFSAMGPWLMGGLAVFFLISAGGMFVSLPGRTAMILAGGGILLFSGWMLFDFNRLSRAAARGVNDWDMAMSFAIDIYLDVILLFLEILEFLMEILAGEE